ncbi:hypothetical protein Goshw_001925 [Gossypium schwendimanii]|uniref:Uncharacterized protein n=1 Tax=Gossypium schwendimanii TaxID=34291 RepID=A0A7J9L0D5_GOSSC|nr:hypothetical protein [Gossypium schwendimanii]
MQHKPSYDPNLIPTLATNSNFDASPKAVLPATPPPSLLYLSFNQDHGYFTVGTNHGFWIYNCDLFREIFRRDFDHCNGCIRVVGMLFRCYILALVGDRPNPQYPPNKVMVWDDNQNRYLKLLHQIETIANMKGLCVDSQGVGSLVLVCPGLQKRLVRIEHYTSKRRKFIMAHDSRIACFALSQDGQLPATTSTKGTLVRVYNSVDGSLLQEWLVVSSDKGTIHVFGLKFNSGSPCSIKSQSASEPPYSSLSFIRGKMSPPVNRCCKRP